MLDIAIIGGGPAGLSAAIKAASEGLSVALYEASSRFGGRPSASPRIDNVPGCPAISGAEYGRTLTEQARGFGAVLLPGNRVVDLTRTSDGTLYLALQGERRDAWHTEARAVLLALGLAPFVPDGLEACRYDCAPGEMGTLAGQSVVFIGGGNGSAQMAIEAAQAGADVFIVSNTPLAENTSAYLLPRLRGADVGEIVGDPAVFRPHDLAPYVVSVPGHDLISADHVYAFTGGDTKTADWLPEEIVRDTDGKVLTGTLYGALPFETHMPGVFAVGDIRSGNTGSITVAQGEAMAAVQVILRQFLPSQAPATA